MTVCSQYRFQRINKSAILFIGNTQTKDFDSGILGYEGYRVVLPDGTYFSEREWDVIKICEWKVKDKRISKFFEERKRFLEAKYKYDELPFLTKLFTKKPLFDFTTILPLFYKPITV